MSAQNITRSASSLFSVLLSAVTLLPGCATTWDIPGTITTPRDRPFYLSSGNQKLLIKPGAMTVTIVEEGLPLTSSRIEIETGQRKIVTKFPRGAVTSNWVFIVGADHGLSANIAMTWTEHSEGQYKSPKTESCDYSCKKVVEVRKCYGETFDSHDKAFKRAQRAPECEKSERVESATCSGLRGVLVTYERYRRVYTFTFRDPLKNGEKIGYFEGVVRDLSRERGRVVTGDCH
jgi:hypothetical protein